MEAGGWVDMEGVAISTWATRPVGQCMFAVRSVAVAFRISEFITTIKRNKSDNSNHKLQSHALCLFRLPYNI